MKSNTLKRLNTKLDDLTKELQSLEKNKTTVSSRIKETTTSIKDVKNKIKALSKKNPTVSEHGILRFLEKEKGIDIKKIIEEMLCDDVVERINVVGSGKIPVGNSVFVVKDRVIVTVTDKNKKGKAKKN